jgi:acylphosphatase
MAHRVHVHIDGRVQGVGFRMSVARKADQLGLNGWVRNLPDGRVEAEFEGSCEDTESILSWCRNGPTFAQVENVEQTWEEGEPRYRRFQIRF